MKQMFKSIYFGGSGQSANSLTLAFGKRDSNLYEKISHLSSHEIRELLGNYDFSQLHSKADKEGIPLNTFCLILLRKQLAKKDGQLPLFVDPIYTTFKGGAKDPLQRWFPYLEGYSPKFVNLLLNEFAPRASTVYDPFAGVGTTPIAAADNNLKGFYSEINPLLQFIIKVKVDARRLATKKKETILLNLRKYRNNLASEIDLCNPDEFLESSFDAVFGKSQFFDKGTFVRVLKSKTFVDRVECLSPITAQFVAIAILSSLIPSSLLQRAGDLRYKNPYELEHKKTDFLRNVDEKLSIIIEDLQTIKPLLIEPILLTEDARRLIALPAQEFDTVITSPPYLNGTNYFRNSKIELWFLKSLQTNRDLSGFRTKTVTAGINDVSSRRSIRQVPEYIDRFARKLEREAYDVRIPKMLRLYFQDMRDVFSGLQKHLRSKSVIAIDIGDSLYGNVHVPTDELLTETMLELGYKHETKVDLRKRLSRNKTVLKQVLLVFSYPNKSNRSSVKSSPTWREKWNKFKTNLPHRFYPYAKRNWGNPLHSLCSYQGKMKPSIAYHLIKTFAKPGDRILDPFSGVGTIPFEAALNGVFSFSFDINPVASVVAEAKLKIADPEECFRLIQVLDDHIQTSQVSPNEIKEAEEFGFNSNLGAYFEHKTLVEITAARNFFLAKPASTPSEKLVLSCLLHILHGNRPYALSRRSHPITPFAPTGKFEYKPLIKHVKEKVARSIGLIDPRNFVEGKHYFQDATSWWPQEVENLDAVITSPPFFDSTRFHLANWMRLWFCGWNSADFKAKPLAFVDERQKQSLNVYIPILRQARERVKKGGVVVFHLGKSRKCDMGNSIAEIAKKWFTVEDIFSESVRNIENHGIRDKGTVVEHQYLVLS